MKKNFIIILVLTIIVGCNSNDGINDPLKRNENWCWFIDQSTGAGEWITVGNDASKVDGDYTLFFSNGKIRQTGKLKDGIDSDTIFYYDINERIISKVFQNKNGELEEIMTDGKYKGYYPTCELGVEGEFKNNIQIGKRIEYYKNGNIKTQSEKNNNQNWLANYTENGQIMDSVNFVNGKLNGIAKYWYPNGELESIQTFKNDSLYGYYCSYYDNGQLKQEGTRWQDLAHDTLTDWFSNGQMKAKRYYVRGLKQGQYNHWFESGKIRVNGSFINDNKHDLYQEFYENGTIKKTGKFSHGSKIGVWNYYDENGTLLSTENY